MQQRACIGTYMCARRQQILTSNGIMLPLHVCGTKILGIATAEWEAMLAGAARDSRIACGRLAEPPRGAARLPQTAQCPARGHNCRLEQQQPGSSTPLRCTCAAPLHCHASLSDCIWLASSTGWPSAEVCPKLFSCMLCHGCLNNISSNHLSVLALMQRAALPPALSLLPGHCKVCC